MHVYVNLCVSNLILNSAQSWKGKIIIWQQTSLEQKYGANINADRGQMTMLHLYHIMAWSRVQAADGLSPAPPLWIVCYHRPAIP